MWGVFCFWLADRLAPNGHRESLATCHDLQCTSSGRSAVPVAGQSRSLVMHFIATSFVAARSCGIVHCIRRNLATKSPRTPKLVTSNSATRPMHQLVVWEVFSGTSTVSGSSERCVSFCAHTTDRLEVSMCLSLKVLSRFHLRRAILVRLFFLVGKTIGDFTCPDPRSQVWGCIAPLNWPLGF